MNRIAQHLTPQVDPTLGPFVCPITWKERCKISAWYETALSNGYMVISETDPAIGCVLFTARKVPVPAESVER